MDTDHFDRLTRILTDARSRRGAVAALLGGSLGVLGLADSAAGKKKKKKKPRNTCTPDERCGSDAQGECICDVPATGGRPVCDKGVGVAAVDSCATCPAGTTCVDAGALFGCFQRCGAAPTCAVNGVKDGAETGVACGGGICPRCADGQSCSSRNDCQSAVCSAGSCQACGFDRTPCVGDADGECFCRAPLTGGSTVCAKGSPAAGPVTSCGMCPAGTVCVNAPGGVFCNKRCGAA